MDKSSASNRVAFSVRGVHLDFEAITRTLGVSPTHTHRTGEASPLKSRPYPCDAWDLESPLRSEEELDVHLKWIASTLRPRYEEIKVLKANDAYVDISWSYITEDQQNGFTISSDALEIFTALGIPFSCSILALPGLP